MNNSSILNTYIKQKIQLLKVDKTGTILETNNTLLPLKKGDNLKTIYPFFESLFLGINTLESETLFPCVEFNTPDNKLLLDVTLLKKKEELFFILSDFTAHYNESNTLIQEKNESVINNQKLLFEKELFKEKEKLTNTFLGNLSHELRAPLSNIVGLISILQESNTLHNMDSEMLRIMKKTSFHMASLLNDLLDISKIKQGQLDLKEVPFKLYAVISYITELYKIKAKNKNLNFVTKVDNDVPKNLIGDPVRLRQILVNLIENAFKHTQSGGIKVHVSNKGAQHNKTILNFDVIDTGKGIDRTAFSSIFKQYYQLENLFNKTQGEGLGLKIVEDLVTLQGGTINVTSEKGKGSCFSVKIPYKTLSKKPQKRKDYKKEDYQGILNIINILIVDDSEIDLMILTKLLIKELYFSIDLATTLQQAQKRIALKKPDIILLDLVLQEENSFSLVKKLKNDPKTKNIPIIMLTARALPSDKEESKLQKVDAFITKPYHKHELLTLINRFVRSKK